MEKKPVNCALWQSNPSTTGGGICKAGHFGGKPTYGVCRSVCTKREPCADMPPISKQARNFAGALGRAAAAFLAPRKPLLVPTEIRKAREQICKSCDKREMRTRIAYCQECGCPLMAKVRAATESCPLGKWEALAVQDLGKLHALTATHIIQAKPRLQKALPNDHPLLMAVQHYEQKVNSAACTLCQRPQHARALLQTFLSRCRALSDSEIQALVDIFPENVYLPYESWNPTFRDLLEGEPE